MTDRQPRSPIATAPTPRDSAEPEFGAGEAGRSAAIDFVRALARWAVRESFRRRTRNTKAGCREDHLGL